MISWPEGHFPRIHHPHHGTYLLAFSVLFALGVFLWYEPWDGTGREEIFHALCVPALWDAGQLDLSDHWIYARQTPAEMAAQLEGFQRQGFFSPTLPLGPGLLLYPFWKPLHFLREWWGDEPSRDWLGPFHIQAVSFVGLFYALLAGLITWRKLTRLVSPRLAFLATLVSFWGGLVYYQILKNPMSTDGFSLFAFAFFFYVALETARFPNMRHAIYLGGATALLSLCGQPGWLYFPVAILAFLYPCCVRPLRKRREADSPLEEGTGLRHLGWQGWKMAGAFLAVWVVLFLPQLLVWQKTQGTFLGGWSRLEWVLAQEDGGWRFLERLTFFLRCPYGVEGQWALVFPLSVVGLIILALRRNMLALGLLISGVLHLLWVAAFLNARQPMFPILWAPACALGLAGLWEEFRTPLVRFGVGACTLLAGLADLLHHAILETALEDSGAALSFWEVPAVIGWKGVLLSLGDSLLLRFLMVGSPPLESLSALLFIVFFIPLVFWWKLRYGLPLARKFHLLKALIGLLGAFVLMTGLLAWFATPPLPRQEANLEMWRRLQEEESNQRKPGYLPRETLEELALWFPEQPLFRLLAAAALNREGYDYRAEKHYQFLANREAFAGFYGVMETDASTQTLTQTLSELERLEWATPNITANVTRRWRELNKPKKAADVLNQFYPDLGTYYFLKAEGAAETPEARLELLRRALLYRPFMREWLRQGILWAHEAGDDALMRQLEHRLAMLEGTWADD